MKLQKQWRDYVLTLELDLFLRRARRVRGVSSLLKNGGHFLMWDFDNADLEAVALALRQTQRERDLPTIFVVATNNQNSYHAYCFTWGSWRWALHVVCGVPQVDEDWIRLSGYRGFFTLRLPEPGETFSLVRVLRGAYEHDLDVVTEIAHYMSWFRDLDKDV